MRIFGHSVSTTSATGATPLRNTLKDEAALGPEYKHRTLSL
jgi:hypothetical protein